MSEPLPPYDPERAAAMVGKRVLIGFTYLDRSGKPTHRKQLHGRITSADGKQGFTVALQGAHEGETYRMPPDLRAFQAAPPGEYRLRTTGEILLDPDFLATWTVTRDAEGPTPPPH